MSKNTQNTQKLSKKDIFLIALENSLGHISKACNKAGIARKTYYNWIDKDSKFKESCDSVNEGLIDLAESKLLENIKNNDNTSIIFFLKTKGKKRGYDERQTIEIKKPFEEIGFEDL